MAVHECYVELSPLPVLVALLSIDVDKRGRLRVVAEVAAEPGATW